MVKEQRQQKNNNTLATLHKSFHSLVDRTRKVKRKYLAHTHTKHPSKFVANNSIERE